MKVAGPPSVVTSVAMSCGTKKVYIHEDPS